MKRMGKIYPAIDPKYHTQTLVRRVWREVFEIKGQDGNWYEIDTKTANKCVVPHNCDEVFNPLDYDNNYGNEAA